MSRFIRPEEIEVGSVWVDVSGNLVVVESIHEDHLYGVFVIKYKQVNGVSNEKASFDFQVRYVPKEMFLKKSIKNLLKSFDKSEIIDAVTKVTTKVGDDNE